MRRIYIPLFLPIIVLPSCHHARHLRRQHEEAKREAAHTEGRKDSRGKYTAESYIQEYKGIAIKQMRKNGIPASIILAQAILESANGGSDLARNANNHFGIKCTKSWTGKTYSHEKSGECFRRYPSVEASYTDHADFLHHDRYATLFRLRSDDYKGWARGLRKAGYATNPKYPQLLTDLIEKYELYKYDE